jgi:ribose transport system ATP-binding protein
MKVKMEKKLLFRAKNITKSFHGTQALKGVDLDVYEGEVVGLIGENGAGKSTLLKIIIGAQAQSSGEMFMHGKTFAPKDPMAANAEGIGMVFQEQSLIVNLSVGQNIFFGHEKDFRRFGVVQWKKMYTQAKKVLEEVGSNHINPRKKVIDLNFATRQMIEIAKVVNVTKSENDQKCLILLDEPTSVLNEAEVQQLFKEIRKLTKKGHSVIFVSHRLDEVLEISDRIYVYKDGENAGNMETSEANEGKLYEAMVGRETTTEYYKLEKQVKPTDEVVMELKDLGFWGCFKHCNITLHRSEILGISGVVGSGKEELCSVICGDEKYTSGEMFIKGKKVAYTDPSQALKDGIIMIPKERLIEGVIRGLSITENIALSNADKLSKNGLISIKALESQADEWIKKLRIKSTGRKELLIQLSGGNQQKVVFARALASDADIIILNHPTRGVDVGAKEEIYNLIRDIVAEGKSVILLGDTLDECIGMSNRILVMRDGLLTGEFNADANEKPTQVSIVSMMM